MSAPQLFKEELADLLDLSGGEPIPFFPVTLGGKLGNVNRTDMLNRGGTIPVFQRPFAFRINHAICPGIEEVFANRWTGFLASLGDNAVNDADGAEFLFQTMRNEQRTKGLSSEPRGHACPFGLFNFGQDGLGGPEMLLPFDLDLPPDSVGLSQVPIGSTLKCFFV